MNKSRARVLRDNAFRSAKRHEPERVKQTRRTRGDAAADRQLTAIALDEARKFGIKA